MPAPDIGTLYQFESHIDAAVKSIIDAQIEDDEITTFIQRSTSELSTPRIEIQFSLAADRKHLVSKDDSLWPNMFSGTLQLAIVTTRSADTSDLHKKYRAVALWLINDYNRQFTEDNLPYHEVCELFLQSATPTVTDDKDQDISTLTFSAVVGIRDDAWPS